MANFNYTTPDEPIYIRIARKDWPKEGIWNLYYGQVGIVVYLVSVSGDNLIDYSCKMVGNRFCLLSKNDVELITKKEYFIGALGGR